MIGRVKGKYQLLNCVHRNIESGGSFEIPTLEEKTKLIVGDFVKLVFEGFITERMWVKITEVNKEGNFVGELDSVPVRLDLYPGDKVEFNLAHICSIVGKDYYG